MTDESGSPSDLIGPASEGRRLELGILSDTHGLLRPELFPALEGVDLLLHAGDVGPAELLDELETIAPIIAVVGNTDGFDLLHRLREIVETEIAGIRTVLLHGHQFGRTPSPPVLRRAFPDAELIVFGHTHTPLMEEYDGCLFVNPGSCGPRRFHLPVGLVRATVEGGLFTGRRVELEIPSVTGFS